MVRRGDWETYFCHLLSRFQLFPTFGTTSARPWHDLGTTSTDTKPLQTLPWHDVTTCTPGSRGEKDAETRRWPETEIQQGKRQNNGRTESWTKSYPSVTSLFCPAMILYRSFMPAPFRALKYFGEIRRR